VGARSVGEDRLDDITVGDGHPDRLRAVRLLDLGVETPYGIQRPGLHLRHRLAGVFVAVREACRRGLVLDHAPEVLLGQLRQLSAGPRPVPRLAQPLVLLDRYAVRRRRDDDGRGLLAPLQRRGDDAADLDPGRGDAAGEGLGLTAPVVVETDPGGPAGQDAGRVRRRPPMAHEQDGGHHAMLGGRTRAPTSA
jgi:hypothetical protein